jgi:hypothetical protein
VVFRAVPAFRAVVFRAVPAFRAVALRAVGLRAVVLRPAVDARRDVDPAALRAALAPARGPPGRAFSACLRAVFNHEALPRRRFAGSFLICFSMASSVLP